MNTNTHTNTTEHTAVHHTADIIVIGSGPAGLAFCRSMANSQLTIALIDPNSAETLAHPPVDGREVSIIRNTERLLTKLGAWQLIDDENKYVLKSAKVFNGDSDYSLNFDTPSNKNNKDDNARGMLGYFVPNQFIRKALFESIQGQSNITTYFDNKVTEISNNDDKASVTLASGDTISAKLVVSADSRYSELRKTMGVSTNIKDFGRNIMLIRMQHTKSNNLVAMECFHYGRTMAVLPLGEYQSSIVITVDSSQAKALIDMDDAEITAEITEQLKGQLGEMTLASEKHCYPLVGVHATKFYAKRYALIGDTAVGMHPVTAQGFNLGMQSQSLLADAIQTAERQGTDIGSEELLAKYSRQHMRITLPLYYGTNAIVHLFTTEHFLVKPLRHAILRAGNNFLPFKYLVKKRLTG